MGRPRKDGTTTESVETMADPMPIAEDEPLKPCPKCGKTGIKPGKDVHGNFRCGCPDCGFWDSMVYRSAQEAAKGWQLAGGPNGEGYYGD